MKTFFKKQSAFLDGNASISIITLTTSHTDSQAASNREWRGLYTVLFEVTNVSSWRLLACYDGMTGACHNMVSHPSSRKRMKNASYCS